MRFFHHFFALMKKNFILYKRNLAGSICEFMCPVVIVGLLIIMRVLIKAKTIDSETQLERAFLSYDPESGNTEADMSIAGVTRDIEGIFDNCAEDDPERSTIGLFPSGDPLVAQLKASLTKEIVPGKSFTVKEFSSSEDIIKYSSASNYEYDQVETPGLCFGISVKKSTAGDYEVAVHFDDQADSSYRGIPSQIIDPVSDLQRAPDKASFDLYKEGGYLWIQNLIANSILRKETVATGYISNLHIPMKSSEYEEDNLLVNIQQTWGALMTIIFVAPIYRLVYNVVGEKQQKVRELMRIMGLTDAPYWLSWFFYYTTIMTGICLVISTMSIFLFTHTSWLVLFIYFWMYGMSLFSYSIFMSSFFSNQKVAGIAATTVHFFTSFLYELCSNANSSRLTKHIFSIFPTVSMQLSSPIMILFESQGSGISFGNWTEEYQNYRFYYCILWQAFSAILFLVLGLYLDNVLPQASGVRKAPWYFFLPSYWGCDRKKKFIESEEVIDEEGKIGAENFEPVSENLKRQVEEDTVLTINNLKKSFGSFKAINGINLEMYSGQIFALLGHNGAGKSTTINCLAGMTPPSSGDARAFGVDAFNQMSKLRKIMGVCPQTNILFPQLTPIEHLDIYADFKGQPRKEKKREIKQLIRDLKLEHKANKQAGSLSGGQKRKLQLGMALIGGSKVVFLDEPSSGMDTTARREMWDMLKEYRDGRIIILTTHYMEEADTLGDRIGIMSHGNVMCCGSPDYLKNKFGEGYNLVIVKNNREDNQSLEDFITDGIPGATKLSEVSTEATFLLPKTAAGSFKEFFPRLDDSLEDLDVSSYGLSMTTLEEVFLRVEKESTKSFLKRSETLGKGDDDSMQELRGPEDRQETTDQEAEDYSISKEQVQGFWKNFFIHLWALLVKRFHQTRRSLGVLVIEILVPILLVAIGFAFTLVKYNFDSDPRVFQVEKDFEGVQRIFYNTDKVTSTGAGSTSLDVINQLTNLTSQYSPVGVAITAATDSAAAITEFDDYIFSKREAEPMKPYRYGSYYFNVIDNTNKKYEIVTFANITSQDAIAEFSHFMYEAILRTATANNNLKYKFIQEPFPVSQRLKDDNKGGNSIFVAFLLSIAFSMIPVSMVSYSIGERSLNLKHQQIISGMFRSAYWVQQFIFDTVKQLILSIITIGLIYIYDLSIPYMWLAILMFSLAIIPYSYVTSFLFKTTNGGENFTLIHHFMIGGFAPLVILILRIIKSTRTIGKVISWILRISPMFCLCEMITNVPLRDRFALLEDPSGKTTKKPLDIDIGGGDLISLALHIVIDTCLLILLEFFFFQLLAKIKKNVKDPERDEPIDEDVVAEEKRVEGVHDNLAVRAEKVRKVYKTGFGHVLACKKTSFALEYRECFALLGINGAGKTTTFKMLTGEIEPTVGNIQICGHDTKKDFNMARRHIGYCPQFDAIFPAMTVREHLKFYCRIKKIPSKYHEKLIQQQLVGMNLSLYENKQAGTLSGGNKRKLNVAMAMLGNPPVVFLDEPSAGMDPQARRYMWKVISKISDPKKDSAVILTTHSMEEAEALSTKMGIMVDGEFKCFGSKQHIKEKYGTGYRVEVDLESLSFDEVQKSIDEKDVVNQLKRGFSKSFKTEMRTNGKEEILLKRDVVEHIINNIYNSPKLLSELSSSGLGKDLDKALKQTDFVALLVLVRWIHINNESLRLVDELLKTFGAVELVEQIDTSFTFRVPKGDRTIGFFFGYLEGLKEEYQIHEYSASQTTLEQIFNGFARIGQDNNGARKFDDQKRPESGSKNKVGPQPTGDDMALSSMHQLQSVS